MTRFGVLIVLAAAGLASSAARAADDPQRLIGKAVLPKAGCQLVMVDPEVDRKTKVASLDLLPLFVNGVEGEAYLVASEATGEQFRVAIEQVMDVAAAKQYYDLRIATDAKDGWAYEMRTMCVVDDEDPLDESVLKRTLADYDAAVRLGRNSAALFGDRSSTRYLLGDVDGALADMTAAMKAEPGNPEYLLMRAAIYADEGQPKKAVADLNAALKLDSEFADALNDLAMLLATSRDDSVRDGPKAVKLSLEACELSDWTQFTLIDTLAAAYAEAGDFDNAVAMQEKAIEISELTEGDDFEGMKDRVKLYKSKRPYRYDPPPKK